MIMLSRAFKNLHDDEDNTSKLSSKRKQFTVDDIKSNEEKTSEGKKAVNM